MLTAEQKKNILTPKKKQLPKNWRRVVGMLRGRRKDLEKHVHAVRHEWRSGKA